MILGRGRVLTPLMVIVYLAKGTFSIYPHQLGSRISESNPRKTLPPTKVPVKTRKTRPSVMCCFAAYKLRFKTECFVKATGRKLSATKSKQDTTKDMKSLDIKFNTLFKLFTNHLLKKIPLPTLVTLTIAEDGRVGRRFERRRKITRVQ